MAYTKVNWANGEAGGKKMNATNFGNMDNGIAANDSAIGDLSTLNTTAKDNLVDAINENVSKIGDLSTLNTTVKDNLVNTINEIVVKNNITTDGSAVKTGRVIDGKDEYTQKINVGSGPNNGSTSYNYKTDDKIITNYYVLGISGNNEIIYAPNSSASGQYFNAFFTGNQLQLSSNIDRSRFTCYLYISYINN